MGKEIHIKLFKKDENGKKEYQGLLQGFNEETIVKMIKEKFHIDMLQEIQLLQKK